MVVQTCDRSTQEAEADELPATTVRLAWDTE